MMDASFPGIILDRGVNASNHDQFVDDTILLGSSSKSIVIKFNDVLPSFLQASGGETNKGKCCVYSWNFSSLLTYKITRIFGFIGLSYRTSFRYRGVSISLRKSKASDWEDTIQKIKL